MLVEMLCGVMSDSAVAHNVRKWTNHDVPANLGQFFLAVDPERFAPGFGDRLQAGLRIFTRLLCEDVIFFSIG
jgi:LDH2 family malate/lactate/ureidoglycolate dehydrogenase